MLESNYWMRINGSIFQKFRGSFQRSNFVSVLQPRESSREEVFNVSENVGNIILMKKRDTSEEIMEAVQQPPILDAGNVFTLSLLEANKEKFLDTHVNFVGLVKEV